jgi:2-polyprenyl-3-methyl-5-hydroxy-6-metoxy-1,4-benzoquinol methylase
MALMGYKVTTIDNNPDMLVQGQRNFPNIKIEYVLDELPNLSSEASKRKYDLVINEGVNEHFLDRNERINVIKAMKGCCIEGGYIYFLVPFLSVEQDEHQYTSVREMESELRDAGFTQFTVTIGVFRTATNTYTMLKVLARNV